VAVVAFGLSSLAFAGGVYWTSERNWAPVQIPIPGPDLVVEEPFQITTPGTFEFEAAAPISQPKSATEDLRIVPCHLEVSVMHDGAELKHLALKIISRSRTQLY